MPHVSRKRLPKDAYGAVLQEFFKMFLGLKATRRDKDFLYEFFTKTERIMFAKRLAILALLLKGAPPYHIRLRLNVSPSTVARMQVAIQNKKFPRLEAVLKDKLAIRGFWEELERALYMGMPPLGRKNDWVKDLPL